MNLGKLLGKVVNAARDNPEIALAVVGLASPALATKAIRAAAKAKAARAVLK